MQHRGRRAEKWHMLGLCIKKRIGKKMIEILADFQRSHSILWEIGLGVIFVYLGYQVSCLYSKLMRGGRNE